MPCKSFRNGKERGFHFLPSQQLLPVRFTQLNVAISLTPFQTRRHPNTFHSVNKSLIALFSHPSKLLWRAVWHVLWIIRVGFFNLFFKVFIQVYCVLCLLFFKLPPRSVPLSPAGPLCPPTYFPFYFHVLCKYMVLG